jgi:hypothetical protein
LKTDHIQAVYITFWCLATEDNVGFSKQSLVLNELKRTVSQHGPIGGQTIGPCWLENKELLNLMKNI